MKINKLLKKYKKYLTVMIIVVIMLICYVVKSKEEVYASNDVIEEVKQLENVSIKTEKETLKVDIKGEILNPGVYELEVGNRIIDVIIMSGGLTDKANTSTVNLSKKLQDEMVIYIPSLEEIDNNILNEELNNNFYEEKIDNNLININKATKEELLKINGIGEAKANAIIEYRKDNLFTSIEDIMNVDGISTSLFEKIKNEITV